MMVKLRGVLLLLGITAGILSCVSAYGFTSHSKDLPSIARAVSKTCSTRDLKFPFQKIPKESSIIVTSDSESSDFCGLAAKIKKRQRLTLKCTGVNLPDDFIFRAFTLSEGIEVTESTMQHTFPEGDRILLLSVSGPRNIDLSNAFECEVSSSSSPPIDTDQCQCGVPNNNGSSPDLDDRIAGGMDAPEGKYPWMVGISSSQNANFNCAGTLITNTKIITAAQCEVSENQYAHIGDYDTSKDEDYTIIKRISAVRNHPNFNMLTLDNDIAVITIESPVQFSSKISPVCLPMTDVSYENEIATAIGWGTLESGGRPVILQEVDVPVTTKTSCASSYPDFITPQMICAGQSDACQGDSGGPLLFRPTLEAPYEIIGVTSWGDACGSPGYPGVYARVTALKSFIFENVGGESELCARP